MFLKAVNRLYELDKLFQQHVDFEFYKTLSFEDDRMKFLSLLQKIQTMKFRIAFIGEFSTGKSSMINAILQQKILPASFKPTTNQVMRIENSDKHMVMIQNAPETACPLSTDNILSLASQTEKSLEISTNIPAPLQRFILYDTPGVNDPAALTEEVVFDLIGKTDIVIFLMKAENALKKTEIKFIQDLVCKKDTDKFFYVINFKDNLEPAQLSGVFEHVANGIATALNCPRKDIEERIFFYSAKQSLAASMAGDWESLAWKEHANMLARISDYAEQKRESLETAALNSELNEIIRHSCQKIDTLIDQLSGNLDHYQDILDKINDELNHFKEKISSESARFEADINKRVKDMEEGIYSDFESIKEYIFALIKEMTDEELAKKELLRKKLRREIEDKMTARMQKFWKGIDDALRDFDKAISTSELEKSLLRIQEYKAGFNFTPLVAGAGTAGVAYVGISAIMPWIIGGASITALAAGATAFFVPGIGSAILSGVSMVGTRAAKGVAKLFSLGTSALIGGYNNLKTPMQGWEGSIKKKKYADDLAKAIDEIKLKVVRNVRDNIDPKALCDAYIEQKFPQKAELENRLKMKISESQMDKEKLENQISNMTAFKNQLERAYNE